MKKSQLMVLMALVVAAPVAAQESGGSVVDRFLLATHLPTVAREARILGVPEHDLQTLFATAREQRMPAASLVELFNEENAAIRKHGPIDNFGAFVQQQLASGLRGRDLAAAIRAEHAARGIGKDRAGKKSGPGEPGTSRGKDDPGRTEKGGRPESPGKSGEQGRKGGTR